MPIVDAFGFAVERLNPISAETLKNVESDDEEIVARAWHEIDNKMREVEGRFRNALAERRLVAKVVGPDGAIFEIIDNRDGREPWRQLALGVPGFDALTDHMTNPGPPDDRPIFIEKAGFKRWLEGLGAQVSEQELQDFTLDGAESESARSSSEIEAAEKKRLEVSAPTQRLAYREVIRLQGRRPRGRKPHVDWHAIKDVLHLRCDEEGGVPSDDMDIGWNSLADAERFIAGVLAERGEKVGETAIREHTTTMLFEYEAKKSQ